MRRAAGLRAAALAALGCLACAGFPETPVLQGVDRASGYRFGTLALGPGNSDETFVVLALSGGGTRAAALAFGAMKAMEDTPLAGGGSLLDEVDVISSVSGGSFAAAYYGVHGKARFFAEFEGAFLHRPLQRELLARLLAPWHWPRLLGWSYGRSDLAAEHYDEALFDRARYGELPRVRPFIVLNATDLSRGIRFPFTQDRFDLLCSDLDAVPVARGVTASSAFPVAFTPLTFENRPKSACGLERDAWVESTLEHDLERNPMRYDRAADHASYDDPESRWIHLADGGLADNIGLRGPVLAMTWLESPYELVRRINEGRVERVVFVVVDAKPDAPPDLDASPRPPGILTVLEKAATTPMEAYSSETVERARGTAKAWALQSGFMAHLRRGCEGFVAERCAGAADPAACRARDVPACFAHFGAVPPEEDPAADVALHRIHVRFAAEPDAARRARLQGIGTALQLPADEVDLLVTAGQDLLRASPGHACVRHAIGAEPPDAAPGPCPEPRRVP